jgi:hypothetical protein
MKCQWLEPQEGDIQGGDISIPRKQCLSVYLTVLLYLLMGFLKPSEYFTNCEKMTGYWIKMPAWSNLKNVLFHFGEVKTNTQQNTDF